MTEIESLETLPLETCIENVMVDVDSEVIEWKERYTEQLKKNALCDVCQFKDKPISECKRWCLSKLSPREFIGK